MSMNQKMIEENIDLVYFLIRQYYPTFIKDEDVVQCGMLGLCQAVDAWDEKKGTTFSTYASYCILNEIRAEFRRRRKHAEVLSLDFQIRDNNGDKQDVGDLIAGDEDVEFVDYKSFYESLSPFQKEIIDYRREGLTLYEIAERKNCSHQNISHALRLMKTKWRKHYGN